MKLKMKINGAIVMNIGFERLIPKSNSKCQETCQIKNENQQGPFLSILISKQF